MIERIPITDRESWLALRKKDVTASVVAALFGAHPYETALGLYAEKAGVEMPDIDNAVLRRGRLLEGAVAAAVAEQHPEWRIIKATDYLRDPDAKIGATPDFYIEGDPRGLGVLQAKTVAPGQFRKHWTDETPPLWIMLQNATELMLEHEATWGAVAVLIVDPWKLDCPIYPIPKHAGVEKRIRDAVAAFWSDIEAGREPNPDYGRDADLLAALYPTEIPSKVVDLTSDNHLPVLLAERAEILDRMKVDSSRADQIETEVKFKLGHAAAASHPDWTITWKTQHRKARMQHASDFRVLRITDHRASPEPEEF
jgi:predicted phage-related endonuclease